MSSFKKPNRNQNSDAKKIPTSIKETYELLRKGFSLKDISSLRKLSEEVISMQIETILEYDPNIEIINLFDVKLKEMIESEMNKGYSDLKELKSRLPSYATYAMIRICIAKNKSTLRRPFLFSSRLAIALAKNFSHLSES